MHTGVVLANDRSGPAPDTRGVCVRQEHLADSWMVVVSDIDRVETGEPSSTALGQNGVDGSGGQIETPVLGKGRDELHRTVTNFAASQIEARSWSQGPL